TLTDDEYDGNFSANDLSLREGLALAALIPGHGTIRFAGELFEGGPATITLTDELVLSSPVSIFGPGAELLTISRHIGVDEQTVKVTDLTIHGGIGVELGNLALERVVITGDSDGVWIENSSLTVL